MEQMFTSYINAPDIPGKFRHQLILDTFDQLLPGEYMHLENDHDPKPLHYQFMMEREGLFVWKYMENGPAIWRVAIGKSNGMHNNH